MPEIRPHEDPTHPKNSSEYHTGKQCIEPGCTNPAGTAWSHLWCQPCNAKRMNGISDFLNKLAGDNHA